MRRNESEKRIEFMAEQKYKYPKREKNRGPSPAQKRTKIVHVVEIMPSRHTVNKKDGHTDSYTHI